MDGAAVGVRAVIAIMDGFGGDRVDFKVVIDVGV